MIVCAGEMESFNFATPVGIGLIDVSMQLTKLCVEKKPDFLLFIGSAGSYGNIDLFEIIESTSACNVENSFLEGRSYTPIDNVVTTHPNFEAINRDDLFNDVYVSRETLVNSSNYITSDSHYSKQYVSQGIELENMEFYAVLKVAQKFGIPAGGVFVVTNYCDEKAHETFKMNHREAMIKLTDYMNLKNRELSD
ncbi:MAG TPA: purine-nucleoside phosphorylase [Epsilonproteobacteria bacterium]|nr:purine-nucleoside phosphorylase [Campylobacterota bacterium]